MYLFVGVVAHHDVFQQVERKVIVPHVGDQFHDIVDEVYEKFPVVVVYRLVDETVECGHAACVSLQYAALSGVRAIDSRIPAHEVTLVFPGRIRLFAAVSPEESAQPAGPVHRLSGIYLQQFPVFIF